MNNIGRVAGKGLFYCMVIIIEGEVVFLPHDVVLPNSEFVEILGLFPCTFEDHGPEEISDFYD